MNCFRKPDILIGALNMHQQQQFVMARPYYHDVLTWCVQKAKPIPTWKNLFRMCTDPIIWAIYTVMAISVIFMGYFLQQFEDFQPKYDWLRLTFMAVCCMSGFVCDYKPKIISNRIFFMFCVFGAMIYVITMMSLILKCLCNPIFEDQIETIEEIIDNSYDLVGDGSALQHLMRRREVRKN